MMKKELIEKLGEEMTDEVLYRDIKYLEEEYYVKVRWFGGKDFFVKITSLGINFIEKGL